MSDELLKLAERCEAATGPDYEIDAQIADAIGKGSWYAVGNPAWKFTASLDAAMTLVPEGCHWWMPFPNEARIANDEHVLTPLPQRCATPALALCAAALRAAQEIGK